MAAATHTDTLKTTTIQVIMYIFLRTLSGSGPRNSRYCMDVLGASLRTQFGYCGWSLAIVSFGSCGMLIVVESMSVPFVPDMMSQLYSDQPMSDPEPRNLSAETTVEVGDKCIDYTGRLRKGISEDKVQTCSANQMAIIPLSVSKIGRSAKTICNYLWERKVGNFDATEWTLLNSTKATHYH